MIDITIDEAIEQEKFKARVDRIKSNKRIFHNNDEDKISACHRSAEEHEQLAEWLEELKVYQQHEIICHKGYNAGYNKAIDDFVEAIDRADREEPLILDMYEIEHMAEQLKVGGWDDNLRK